MYEAVQKCNHCGANLSLDDLRRPGCPYCNTVYPHKSQAAQAMEVNAQLAKQMIGQMAQVQDQWRAALGAPPVGMPPAGGPPGGPPPGGVPAFMVPQNPMPYGMPPPPGAPGSPYADPMRIAAMHAAGVAGVSRTINRMVITIVAVTIALVMAGIAMSLFLR